MADSPRIQELRRRIQADPASLAFAPLAEELRRAGRPADAVGTCRAGLAIHPEYASGRATLGRALLDLGELDQALVELTRVLAAAPEHLSALKGVAEIHTRRGDHVAALTTSRQALALAREDAELSRAIAALEQADPPDLPMLPGQRDAGDHAAVVQRLEHFLACVLADRERRL